MEKISVELRLLATFVSACQHTTVSEAAASIGQTPSALSTALHNLEDRFDLRLFERQGNHLGLLPAAFWLFRNACQILQLEAYTRSVAARPDAANDRLIVHLDLSLALGRFSKALVRATEKMARLHPETFVEWRIAGVQDQGEDRVLPARIEQMFVGGSESVTISYDEGVEGEGFPLAQEPWVICNAQGRETDYPPAPQSIIVMRMRPPLLQAVGQYARQNGIEEQLKYIDDEPNRLGRLLQEFPQMRFIMPMSMMSDRMGLSRMAWASLSPPLVSPMRGHAAVQVTGKGAVFFDLLRQELAATESNVHFEPRATMRQIQHFNLVSRSGGISAAARAANVSQSSVSSQMQKLEAACGAALLVRRGDGIALSGAGAAILPFTTALDEALTRLVRQASNIAAHSQANIKIGTLPSSGHDSVLTDKIARAITAVHNDHPTWKLHVSEGSNHVLHEMVRSGELNLAVVGAVQPQVARIPLGPSEQLSVVANPRLSLPSKQELGIEDVCGLPLVLGAGQLSIHQNFVQAARSRKIRITPVLEVGSLALAIAMVRSSWLCTILPASSVRRDVEAGLLVTVPIRRDEIPGALSIIFSADRSLSEAERIIIREMMATFQSIII